MNYYSEDIINNIIDKEEPENIITKLEDFSAQVKYLFTRFSSRIISNNYTNSLLTNEQNKVAFYCMDFEFSISNCPSIMIYQKHLDRATNETHYYILLICTKPKYKNMGYASMLLTGFIERVKTQNRGDRTIRIILSSLESAVTFYESYGFKWTRKCLTEYPHLMKSEKYDETKEYFMLELVI